MAQDVGVVIIHGMGSQPENFAVAMVDRLEREVRKRGEDSSRIAFEAIWWAGALIDKERELLGAMTANARLDWMGLRTFVVNNLADALAYQKTARVPAAEDERPVYDAIHAAVAMHLNQLAKNVRPTAPLVVIAHSLGCHIMSNYIWDAQRPTPSQSNHVIEKANPFENCETLTTIATFGCNMPLFLLSNERVEPIRFPAANAGAAFPGKTPAQIAEVATWTNFFDRDDVLAWPLQPLAGYDRIVKDVQVNAGGWLSWSPRSHQDYWTDASVVKPIAATLAKILALL